MIAGLSKCFLVTDQMRKVTDQPCVSRAKPWYGTKWSETKDQRVILNDNFDRQSVYFDNPGLCTCLHDRNIFIIFMVY